jgi:hypothetical protein
VGATGKGGKRERERVLLYLFTSSIFNDAVSNSVSNGKLMINRKPEIMWKEVVVARFKASCPAHIWRERRKLWKNLIRIVDILAEVLTGHDLNGRKMHFCLSQLLTLEYYNKCDLYRHTLVKVKKVQLSLCLTN